MKIVVIGDIFGKPGRMAVRELLPQIVADGKIDFVIANCENAAGGKGITQKIADELFESPIDVMTGGNHIWEQKDIYPYFESHAILRPYNVRKDLPGRGAGVFVSLGGANVGVVSLQGRLYFDPEKGEKSENPFYAADEVLKKLHERTDVIIIDFHAEATSEKRCLAWYLEGKMSALIGTHTHVQTADEGILPGGSAYISDVGMTGPHHSVIGLDKDVAIHRFLTGEKKKFKVATDGVRLEAVLIDVDEKTGKALSIKRVKEEL